MTPYLALAPVAATAAVIADAIGTIALVWLGGQIMFGDSQPFELLAFQVGLIGAVACLADRRAVRAFPIALIGFAGAAMVSAWTHRGNGPFHDWFQPARQFFYMLVFVFGAAYLLRSKRRLAWFVVLMSGAIVVIAVQLLFDRASSDFVYNRADTRYIASVSQWAGIHQLGFVLVTGLPLCLAVTLGDTSPQRRVAAAVLSLFLMMVAWLNGSRTAILIMSVIVAGMTVMLLPRRRVGWRTIAGIAAIVMIAAASVFAVFTNTWSVLPDVRSLSGDRAPIWRAALQMFLDHPLLGVGPTGYQTAMLRDGYAQAFLPWYPANAGGVEQAHNWPLQVAAETGIVGIASLLWFFVSSWRKSLALRRSDSGIVAIAIGAGLLAIFLRCLFDNFMGLELTAFRMRPFVWFFFAAAVALHRRPPLTAEAAS